MTSRPVGKRTLFPSSMNVNLKYCQQVTLSLPGGTPALQVFRANSIFDPDYTGTGHQPLGMDQLGGLYGRYEVLSSTIRARYTTNSSVNDTVSICCWLDEDGALAGTMAGMMEQSTASWTTNPGVIALPGMEVSNKFTAVDFFGGKSDGVANWGSNPSRQAFFNIAGYSPVTATSGVLTVEIIYTVRVSGPIEVAQS